MKDLLVLLAHLLTTLAILLGPVGARSVVADSLLMKQQLLVINRSRRRAPNFSALDRILLGFWSLFLSPRSIQPAAVIIRPSTLDGDTPAEVGGDAMTPRAELHTFRWQTHCRTLYQLPVAA